MKSLTFLIALALFCSSTVAAGTPQRSTIRTSSDDLNLAVATDARQIAISAALVLAGYSAPGGVGNDAIRDRVRSLLARVDPALKERLATYYRTQRRAAVAEDLDAARYRALGLMLTPPPSLSLGVQQNRIPEDLGDLVGFGSLAGELYRSEAFRTALPQLNALFEAASRELALEVRPIVATTLDYLHTVPITQIDIAAVRNAEGKVLRPAVSRVRKLKIFADPVLDARTVVVRGDVVDGSEGANFQQPGDRVTVLAGASIQGSEAVRLALLRFVLNPIVERHSDPISEQRLVLDEILLHQPMAKTRYEGARYALIADSLVSAVNARLRVREKTLGPNSAIAQLADSRDRGEALTLHFYDQLVKIENVGLDISVVFPQLLASLDAKAERGRDSSIAAARAAAPSERVATAAADDTLAKSMIEADGLITRKRFSEARPLLESILQRQPGNARALFGMAQVIENTPDAVEADTAAAEDDRAAAQAERLERSVNLYRSAAQNATVRELWISSWSHVYAGRILDFLDLREEAVAEYQAAANVGAVPDGAFEEAQKGLKAPYTQAP